MYTYPVVEGLEITIDIVQYLITWFRPRFILKLAEKKKIPKVKNILWFMGGAKSQRIKSNMIYYYNKKY